MDTPKKIFIQAGAGSFNDHAIHILQKSKPELAGAELEFCGTPSSAMQRADEAKDAEAHVFTAVRNGLVKGNLIPPTIEGMRRYEVQLKDAIRMKIEMCLLTRQDENGQPMERVASIRPALDQINGWLKTHGLSTIEVPEGTSEAARKLSAGELEKKTGVIAPERCASTYPGLEVREKGIQDDSNNYTHFALLKVKKREVEITVEQAREELQAIVDEIRRRTKEDEEFHQIMQAA